MRHVSWRAEKRGNRVSIAEESVRRCAIEIHERVLRLGWRCPSLRNPSGGAPSLYGIRLSASESCPSLRNPSGGAPYEGHFDTYLTTACPSLRNPSGGAPPEASRLRARTRAHSPYSPIRRVFLHPSIPHAVRFERLAATRAPPAPLAPPSRSWTLFAHKWGDSSDLIPQ